MILPDTSVWIDHLRAVNATLKEHLQQEHVLMHPYMLGELALASLADRSKLLESLDDLPQATLAETDEVRQLIEHRGLYNRGIGWVDAHLASTLFNSSIRLWILDKRLARTASQIGVPLHFDSLPN